jgi:hypothetical protein
MTEYRWVPHECDPTAVLLPAAALDDFAEYRRQGGRFDLDTWWARYWDDYTHSSES